MKRRYKSKRKVKNLLSYIFLSIIGFLTLIYGIKGNNKVKSYNEVILYIEEITELELDCNIVVDLLIKDKTMNTVVFKDNNGNTFNTVLYSSRSISEGQELQGYYDTKSNTYYVNLGLNKYIYYLAIVLGICLVLIAIVILLQ